MSSQAKQRPRRSSFQTKSYNQGEMAPFQQAQLAVPRSQTRLTDFNFYDQRTPPVSFPRQRVPTLQASYSTSQKPMSPEDMTSWFVGALQDPNVQHALKSAVGLGDIVNSNTNRINDLEEDMSDLRLELEQLKQYTRRNAIRIYNRTWPPEDKNENTDQMVLRLINETLGITTITSKDISRSHRVGKPERGPRPILVKFTGYRAKELVMKEKSKLPQGASIYEDLSPYVASLAYEARQLKRTGRISDTWVYDGRIYIKPTSRHTRGIVVQSAKELKDAVPPANTNVTFAHAATDPPGQHRLPASQSSAAPHKRGISVTTSGQPPQPQRHTTAPAPMFQTHAACSSPARNSESLVLHQSLSSSGLPLGLQSNNEIAGSNDQRPSTSPSSCDMDFTPSSTTTTKEVDSQNTGHAIPLTPGRYEFTPHPNMSANDCTMGRSSSVSPPPSRGPSKDIDEDDEPAKEDDDDDEPAKDDDDEEEDGQKQSDSDDNESDAWL